MRFMTGFDLSGSPRGEDHRLPEQWEPPGSTKSELLKASLLEQPSQRGPTPKLDVTTGSKRVPVTIESAGNRQGQILEISVVWGGANEQAAWAERLAAGGGPGVSVVNMLDDFGAHDRVKGLFLEHSEQISLSESLDEPTARVRLGCDSDASGTRVDAGDDCTFVCELSGEKPVSASDVEHTLVLDIVKQIEHDGHQIGGGACGIGRGPGIFACCGVVEIAHSPDVTARLADARSAT
jgi:hypothetical protein